MIATEKSCDICLLYNSQWNVFTRAKVWQRKWGKTNMSCAIIVIPINILCKHYQKINNRKFATHTHTFIRINAIGMQQAGRRIFLPQYDYVTHTRYSAYLYNLLEASRLRFSRESVCHSGNEIFNSSYFSITRMFANSGHTILT